jgi:hypothetical protein
VLQVHDEKRDLSHHFGGACQLGHQAAELKPAFALPKRAFNGHSGGGIGTALWLFMFHLVGVGLVDGLWAVQGWPREANPFAVAALTILTGTVNVVRVNRGRVMSKPSMAGFDLLHQVHGFVIGVPTDPIHKTDPIDAGDKTILNVSLVEFGKDGEPELGAFGVAVLEPEEVLLFLKRDAQGHIDGLRFGHALLPGFHK